MSRCIAWSVAAVLVSVPARAQEPVGPVLHVSNVSTGVSGYPAVAADAVGNFVVVWHTVEGFGYDGVDDVSARRFDRFGRPFGPQSTVNTHTTGAQAYPRVAATPTGAFVVAWSSDDGDGLGVFMRRYDASGGALDAVEFGVNAYTTGDQGLPDVAVDAAGNFVVTWWGMSTDSQYRAVARRFAPSGLPLGPEFIVSAYTTRSQEAPRVARTPDGRFVVAWTEWVGGSTDIAARLFDAAGVPLGSDFRVNAYTFANQRQPDVAVDAAGNFIVVWESDVGDGHEGAVFGRTFDASGSPGAEFVVEAYTTGTQRQPSVGRDPDGNFLVAWTRDLVVGGSSDGLFGQRFDAGGGRIGTEFAVAPAGYRPAVATTGAEKYVVAWDGLHPSVGALNDIYGQRYGDLIFRDGFETKDTSRWSLTADDSGDLVVGAGLASTLYGLEGTVDDVNALYVQDDTPLDEGRYRVRFHFDTGDFDPGESQAHRRTRIFLAFEETPNRRLMAVVLRRIAGSYSVMGRARRDDNSQANTTFVPIGAGAHWIELDWRRSTGPDALDGRFDMWVDGVAVTPLTGLDNSISAVDFVRLGALSVKTGAAGTLRWDHFESRREFLIGP